MNKRLVSVVGLAAFATAVTSAYLAGRASASGIPAKNALVYEGVLTDAANQPLASPQNLQVRFWDKAEASGAGDALPLCSVGPNQYELKANGSFQVALPDSCTAAVRGSPDVWVELLVGGGPLGRSKLGAVPYAVEADHAVVAQSTMAIADAGASSGLTHHIVEAANLATSTVCKANAAPNEAIVDCTCPTGTYALSGGGWGTGGIWLRESRPLNATAWRLTCVTGAVAAGATSVTVTDTRCNGFSLVCSRLAP